LHDLNQHHLPALDDFLDLVLAARPERALRHLFQHVLAADGFHRIFLGVLVFLLVMVLATLDGDGGAILGRDDLVAMMVVVFGMRRAVVIGDDFRGMRLGLVLLIDAMLGVLDLGFGLGRSLHDRAGRLGQNRGGKHLAGNRLMRVMVMMIVMIMAVIF